MVVCVTELMRSSSGSYRANYYPALYRLYLLGCSFYHPADAI